MDVDDLIVVPRSGEPVLKKGNDMFRKRLMRHRSRRGTIAVLAAILSVVLMGMVAFCVDIGYVLSAKEELQRTADASALATCWEYAQRVSDGYSSADSMTFARAVTSQYASQNHVTGHGMTLNTNSSNAPDGDVVFGYIEDFNNSQSPLQTGTHRGFDSPRLAMANQPHLGKLRGQIAHYIDGLVGRTVIDDDDLKPARQVGKQVEQFADLCGQGCFGIPHRDDDAQGVVQGGSLEGVGAGRRMGAFIDRRMWPG